MRRGTGWQQTVLAFTAVAALGGMFGAKSGPITRLSLDPGAEIVPLFAGRDDGRFDIRMTAQDAHRASVVIENKTDEPLTVALPKAAVGVHVLPQLGASTVFGGPGNNPFSLTGTGQQNPLGQPGAQGNQSQGVGGPMQATGQQTAGPGQSPNPFGFPSVPPEWVGKPELASFAGFATIPAGKAIQLRMRTVCLNYGRPEPSVKKPYRLVPVEEFSPDPVLAELLESYSPRTNQDAQQAAAWHVANGLTWDQLRQLPDRVPGSPKRMFARAVVEDAQSLVDRAEVAAKTRARAEHVAQTQRGE